MRREEKTVMPAPRRAGDHEKMTEKKPNYKWPRFVLALVFLFVAATLVWMAIEIHNIKQERDLNAPIQGH